MLWAILFVQIFGCQYHFDTVFLWNLLNWRMVTI